MLTEAQKEAKRRYRAKRRIEGKHKSLTIEFKEEELPLLEHARAQKNTTAYIKDLIAKEAGVEG